MARFYENPMNQPKQAGWRDYIAPKKDDGYGYRYGTHQPHRPVSETPLAVMYNKSPLSYRVPEPPAETATTGPYQPTGGRVADGANRVRAMTGPYVNTNPTLDTDQPPPDQPPPDQPPPTPRTPQLGDFKTNWKDPEYNAQIASLNKALQDYETGAQQRADRYGQDFRTGVQQMGYRPAGETGFGDVLATPEPQMASRMAAPTEPQKMGQWDLEGQFDPYSSAARGTRGLRDEFAARGTLRSSDFGQTFGEFQNRLSDQLDAMNLSRSRFGEDLQTEIAGQRSGTEERSQAAERAASQRAATNQMNAYMRALAGG